MKRLYRVDEPWPENGTLPPEVDANTLPKGLANRLTTGKIDFMTVPDVIFPIFLFIVGLSIPIALERRIASGRLDVQALRARRPSVVGDDRNRALHDDIGWRRRQSTA